MTHLYQQLFSQFWFSACFCASLCLLWREYFCVSLVSVVHSLQLFLSASLEVITLLCYPRIPVEEWRGVACVWDYRREKSLKSLSLFLCFLRHSWEFSRCEAVRWRAIHFLRSLKSAAATGVCLPEESTSQPKQWAQTYTNIVCCMCLYWWWCFDALPMAKISKAF